jgi:hypothetical protein
MKFNIYSIKDNYIGAFQTPIPAQNDAVMIRNVKIAMMNPTSQLYLQKDSLSLYKLGTFDDATGELTSDVQCISSSLAEFLSEEDVITRTVRKVVDELEREREKESGKENDNQSK